MAIVLMALACGPFQASIITPVPSSTSTLTGTLAPSPTLTPTDTQVPIPTPTNTVTPTSTPPVKRNGPFRGVTSLADLPLDSSGDVQVRTLSDGSVWIITSQSVLRWDGQMWEVVLSESKDMLAAVDDSGRLWVLRQDASEIAAWQDGQWTTYGADSGWTSTYISGIARWWAPAPWRAYSGAAGTFWLPMEQDVRLFDGSRWNRYTLEDMGFPAMEAEDIGIVHSLAVREDGAEVWVGECYYSGPGPMGGKGVRWFDGKTWHEVEAPVGSKCVSVIEIDSLNNVWLAGSDVVRRYEPESQTWTSYLLPEALLMDYNFTRPLQLIVDRAGDVWVMMEMCGGASCSSLANIYRIHNGEWSLVIDSQDWNLSRKQLVLDGSGQGWLFYDGTVYQLEAESMQSVASIMVRSVDVSLDGRMWVLDESEDDPTLWIFEPEGAE